MLPTALHDITQTMKYPKSDKALQDHETNKIDKWQALVLTPNPIDGKDARGWARTGCTEATEASPAAHVHAWAPWANMTWHHQTSNLML